MHEEPSAPYTQFYHNLYPKVVLPEFDMNNCRINCITKHYEFLDKERKPEIILKRSIPNYQMFVSEQNVF